MRIHLFFLGILIPISINAANEKSCVNNNTDDSLKVEFIVPAGCSADIQYSQPKSAQELLHIAIRHDSPYEIRRAIQVGADVNKDKDGKSLLSYAVKYNRANAVEALLELGAQPNDVSANQIVTKQDMKLLLILAKQSKVAQGIKKASKTVCQALKEAIAKAWSTSLTFINDRCFKSSAEKSSI